MTSRRTRLAMILLVALLATGVVDAQLAAQYAGWADGPEGFLLTKEERKAWDDVASDSAARDFIALFWERRNPNPGQPFNRFKADFEARVRYADDNFASEGVRGALSDRGRVLILMGTPHAAEKRAPTETVETLDNTAAGSDEVRANAEMWTYDPARLPEGFKIKGSQLLFVFYESRSGSNYFTLDRSHREATMALRAMSRAPEVYLLHPDLDEAPKPVAVPNAEPADATQLAWLEASPARNDQLRHLLEIGVADATHLPVWLHLELPKDAPRLEALAGRVLSAAGEVLSTFQLAPQALPTASGGVAYHLTFPLEPGSYRIEVAGAATGTVEITWSGDVTVPTVPDEGTWMSPIWAGLSAEMEAGAPLGQAFTFGGWHLRPFAGGPVPHASELSFFGFVVRPGGADQGPPQLEARITLRMGETRLGRPLTMALEAIQIFGDLWLYANAVNLSGLPEAGDYSIELTVRDRVAEAISERSLELQIVD